MSTDASRSTPRSRRPRLRLAEVRGVFVLLAGARNAGGPLDDRRRFLLEKLGHLTGASVGLLDHAPCRPDARTLGLRLMTGPAARCDQATTWHRALPPTGVGVGLCAEPIVSIRRIPSHGCWSYLCLGKGSEEPAFSRRHRLLAALLHSELARQWHQWSPHPVYDALSARLRQTLACLLRGDAEKQVALRLGISRHTVHKYVTELHRRFGVASRGELLCRARNLTRASLV